MSNYQPKPGQGAVFINDQKSENGPDLKGDFLGHDGNKYRIAMWKKTSQAGKEYYSIKIELMTS
jgi:uncharacterized protein (DUF736 family)